MINPMDRDVGAGEPSSNAAKPDERNEERVGSKQSTGQSSEHAGGTVGTGTHLPAAALLDNAAPQLGQFSASKSSSKPVDRGEKTRSAPYHGTGHRNEFNPPAMAPEVRLELAALLDVSSEELDYLVGSVSNRPDRAPRADESAFHAPKSPTLEENPNPQGQEREDQSSRKA